MTADGDDILRKHGCQASQGCENPDSGDLAT
jgi:hypothetical protein